MARTELQAAVEALRDAMGSGAAPVMIVQGSSAEVDRRLAAVVRRRFGRSRTLGLPCRRQRLNPFAGVTELSRQLFRLADELGQPELAFPHWIALHLFAPDLARAIPARRPEACINYDPVHLRRRVGDFWLRRCGNSLVDLIFALQDALGSKPLAIGFTEIDQAGTAGRELFALLCRRSAGRPIFIWATTRWAAAPALLESVRAAGRSPALIEAAGAVEPAPPLLAPDAPAIGVEEDLSVAELIEAADYYSIHGARTEAAEYARRALLRMGPEQAAQRPRLLEALRVCLNNQDEPEAAQQLLLQELPLATSRKYRVVLLNWLAVMHGQGTNQVPLATFYAERAMAEAERGATPAERAECRLIAAHGLVLAYAQGGRLREAQTIGLAVYADLLAHCSPETERVRQSMLLFLMAQNWERLGEPERAVEFYRSSIEVDRHYPEYYRFLVSALSGLGRHEEALAVCEEAMERTPPYWRLHTVRGQALLGLGRHEEALAEFARAIELEPRFADVYLYRALFLHEQGRLAEAVADYTAYLHLAPGNPEALANRGSARHDLGDLDGALQDLTTAVEVSPFLVAALANRAAVLADLGRPDEARDELRRALRLDPGNEILQENLASLSS